jgi:hypothetical protein
MLLPFLAHQSNYLLSFFRLSPLTFEVNAFNISEISLIKTICSLAIVSKSSKISFKPYIGNQSIFGNELL